MTDRLRARLAEGGPLLADGATGTNLFAMGLQTGDAPELWNIEYPERIHRLHQSFIDAGSDIILTNSFGGTHFRLNLHGAGLRVAELNRAAARLAREDADRANRDVLVGGSIGPTGEILEPSGTVSIEVARQAFREQAEALIEGGVDVLWIETMSSADEITAAVLATSEFEVPVVCTASIDTNGRTMMGLTPADVVNATLSPGREICAIGTNCGLGAAEVVAAVCNLRHAIESLEPAPSPLPFIVAKANCGIPEYRDGKIVYNGTPELMAHYAILAANAGARIIGGCCGTSPAHLQAMRQSLDQWQPGAVPDAQAIAAALGDISQGALAQLAGDLSIAGGSASGRGSRQSRRRSRPGSGDPSV